MPLHASLPIYQDGRAPPPSVRVPRPVVASHPLAIAGLSTWCEAKQPAPEPHGAGPCMGDHLQHAEAATSDADPDIINTPPCTTPVACVPRAISGSSYVTTCGDPPSPPSSNLSHTCSTAGESSSDVGLAMICPGSSHVHLAVSCTEHALPTGPAPVPQQLSDHCSHTPRDPGGATHAGPSPQHFISNLQQTTTTFRALTPVTDSCSPACVPQSPVPTLCHPQPVPFLCDSKRLVTPRATQQPDLPVSRSNLCPPTIRHRSQLLATGEDSQLGTDTQHSVSTAVQQPLPGLAFSLGTILRPDRAGAGTPVQSHALSRRPAPVQPYRHADFDAFLWASDTSDSASCSDEEQAPVQQSLHVPAGSAMPGLPSRSIHQALSTAYHSHMELPAHDEGDSGWPVSASGPQVCSQAIHVGDSPRHHAYPHGEIQGHGLPRPHLCSRSASVHGSPRQRPHGQGLARRVSMDAASGTSSSQRHVHGEMHGHATPRPGLHDMGGASHTSSPRHYVYQCGLTNGQGSPMAIPLDMDVGSNASWSAPAMSELFMGVDAACDQIQVLLQESEHYQAAYRAEQARCHVLEQQLARERTTWGLERGNLRSEWCGRWGCVPVIDSDGGPVCLHAHPEDQHASAGLDAWVGATEADAGLSEAAGESEGESEEMSGAKSDGEDDGDDEDSNDGTLDSDEGLSDETEGAERGMQGAVPATGSPGSSQAEDEQDCTGPSSSASFTSATDGQPPPHESGDQGVLPFKRLQRQQEQWQQQELGIGLLKNQLSCALNTCKSLLMEEDIGLAQVLQLLQAAVAKAEQLNIAT